MYAAGNVNYGHGIQPFLWKLDSWFPQVLVLELNSLSALIYNWFINKLFTNGLMELKD